MDSDSDSDSSVRSSGTAAFRSFSTVPPSPGPSDPQYERGPLGEQFLVVDHTANLTAGAKVSGIWHHGGERRRTDNGSWDRYWRCGHCTKKKLFKISEHVGGLLDSRRTRATASSVAARSTASTAGSIARLLAMAMLQQQEPLLYTMES